VNRFHTNNERHKLEDHIFATRTQ